MNKNVRASTTINALTQFLRPVILIQEIMRDFLQIGQMAMQERAPNGQEIRMPRVIDLDDTPGVLPRADAAPANVNDVFRTDDGEGHEAAEFAVLFHRVLVVFFDVVGEVVDGDAVVFDVFHDEFFGFGELGWGEGVGFADYGDYVDTGGESLHEFDVEFAEAGDRYLVYAWVSV